MANYPTRFMNVFCDYRQKIIKVPIDTYTEYLISEISEAKKFSKIYKEWSNDVIINDPSDKDFVTGMPKYEFIKNYKFAFCFHNKENIIVFIKSDDKLGQFVEGIETYFEMLFKLVSPKEKAAFTVRVNNYMKGIEKLIISLSY